MSTNPSPFAGTQAPTGNAGGDLGGTFPNPTVVNVSDPGTVTGTTVTAASSTTIASGTYLANTASVGSVFRLMMSGHGTWGSTAQSLTFVLQLGGTGVVTSVTMDSTAFATSASFRWVAECHLICVTTGSSGTWLASVHGAFTETAGNFAVIPLAAASNTVAFAMAGTAGVTKDTTTNQALTFKVAWASTTGAPTITQDATWFQKIA